jgi:hypothetical protein
VRTVALGSSSRTFVHTAGGWLTTCCASPLSRCDPGWPASRGLTREQVRRYRPAETAGPITESDNPVAPKPGSAQTRQPRRGSCGVLLGQLVGNRCVSLRYRGSHRPTGAYMGTRWRPRSRVPERRGRGSPTRVTISGFPTQQPSGTAINGRVTRTVLAWTTIQGPASWARDCRQRLAVVEEADSVAAARSLQDIAVLVDVELPDGGGIALTPELAALPWHPRVEERHGANSPRLPDTNPLLARLVWSLCLCHGCSARSRTPR